MEWNCYRLVAWICLNEQVDWSPRPTIYDNEGLLKACFVFEISKLLIFWLYTIFLWPCQELLCVIIYVYTIYIYIYIFIYTHIFPASVATSSISFLLNATGRFLVIISLTHPRKGFEKKTHWVQLLRDLHPGMTLDSSAWGQKSLYAPGGPVHLLTGKTCDLSGKTGSKPWLVELPGRVWKSAESIGWNFRSYPLNFVLFMFLWAMFHQD